MKSQELWELHDAVVLLLAKRLNEEKQRLEGRLASLGAKSVRSRRPYPKVLPKFANPDEPNCVWSGRGKQPQWVREKLASGLTLKDLRIAAAT